MGLGEQLSTLNKAKSHQYRKGYEMQFGKGFRRVFVVTHWQPKMNGLGEAALPSLDQITVR